MTPLYESRQVRWFPIGMVVVMLIFCAVISTMTEGEPVPWWVYLMLPVLVLPFSVMSVRVTREHVRVSFLLTLPRRTIPIADIRSCEPYRAQGLQRLQTQVKPLHGRYQLKGSGGGVITPTRGIPIHISDPEPEKLARAVERARGKARKE